jgi:uncharacterized membrane protein
VLPDKSRLVEGELGEGVVLTIVVYAAATYTRQTTGIVVIRDGKDGEEIQRSMRNPK